MPRLYFIIILFCAVATTAAQSNDYDYPEFRANTIPGNYFADAVNKVSLTKFTPDSALQLLYPGRLYKFSYMGDKYTIMAWRCPHCKIVSKPDEWQETNDTFPPRYDQTPKNDGIQTRIVASIPFKNASGHNCMLFATSSTELGDVILTGRFSCGWLGLAVFEQINNNWLVTAFNPAVLCAGSYSMAPEPDLITYNGITQLCKIEKPNGAAGGPYISNIFIIGHTQQTMHTLLTKSMASRDYSIINWGTTVIVKPDSAQPLPQLILTTKGDFIRDALTGDYDSAYITQTFPAKITSQPETSFTITTTYRYNATGKKTYALVSKKTRTKPLVKKKE